MADVEMVQRTLCLGAPVTIGWDVHVAHGIKLTAQTAGIDADGNIAKSGLLGHGHFQEKGAWLGRGCFL